MTDTQTPEECFNPYFMPSLDDRYLCVTCGTRIEKEDYFDQKQPHIIDISDAMKAIRKGR